MDWIWVKALGFSAGGGLITLAGLVALSRWSGDALLGLLFARQKAKYTKELEDKGGLCQGA
jgi:hypothetical protein